MRLGVDMGATSIKTGLVDEQGRLWNKETTPTQADKGEEAVLYNLENACRLQMERQEVECIGIGIAGRVEAEKGVLVDATNLPIGNFAVAPFLKDRLGLPVYLGNDANCALLGEITCGEGKNSAYADENMLMVTVGTGIGGAMEIRGEIFRGRWGNAAEFGHMTISNTGERCRCGRTGCWEHYASVSGLIRQTLTAARENPESLLAQKIREEGGAVDGRTVFTAEKEGCSLAGEVIDRYAGYLADGINNLTVIFRPDRLVLAGEIFNEGESFFSRIAKRCKDPSILRVSSLHDRAGILGAAQLCDFYTGSR